ncbi:hypothetical protein OBBRIDRAFT_787165 [Obba rivulosa]|uniref:Uncharacterized protein n=1 Tax=Obba rivulosa TaxID=1052685 RepID=A0A8E2DVJ8_9APHY|nr:hypothetical protein OBBRIDRAFT_787165 [Obba rivulosa]
MLKRQRPSSPIPSLPTLPGEQLGPSFESFERVTKRRRQFTPSGSGTPGNPYDDGEDDDDDEQNVDSEDGRSEYFQGRSRWQEQAGEYKHANTLLHDLHAEQRHRMLFSSSSSFLSHSTTALQHSHTDNTTSTADMPAGHHSNQHLTSPSPPLAQSSKVVTAGLFPHSRIGSEVTDDVEVQKVIQRYENTNRLLASLDLSRRQRLGHQ